MQIHQLQKKNKPTKARRVGRGGKRGTYSGRGMKGQKSRAGASQRADFRGGDQPLWKLFPKKRGATKKVDVKHRTFALRRPRPVTITLDALDKAFEDGATVNKLTLLKKKVITSGKNGAKIVARGKLSKKLTIDGIALSKTAADLVAKAGGTVKASNS